MPRIPVYLKDPPSKRERMNALHTARTRMTEIMAKLKLTKALRLRVPGAANQHLKIGDKVLIYHDTLGQWIGPHPVIDVDHNMVHIDQDGRTVIMSVDKCKHYKVEEDIRDLVLDHTGATEKALRNDATVREIDAEFLRNEGFSDNYLEKEYLPEIFLIHHLKPNDPGR